MRTPAHLLAVVSEYERARTLKILPILLEYESGIRLKLDDYPGRLVDAPEWHNIVFSMRRDRRHLKYTTSGRTKSKNYNDCRRLQSERSTVMPIYYSSL